jgi:hypothetical protein
MIPPALFNGASAGEKQFTGLNFFPPSIILYVNNEQ